MQKSHMTIPTYVDIARLCHELSISERTVDAWVRQNILPPPIQRGGKRFWKWREVERYLDQGGPSAPPSADQQAEDIRNATKRMAEEAAANRRGHIRRRDPRLPG
jgi:predicted site-specific integrase-resolvase